MSSPISNARLEKPVETLDYLAFDADNHYYEAHDTFTRHVDPSMRGRCVQWAEIDGRKRHMGLLPGLAEPDRGHGPR